jgi:N-acetylneuraminic acid mutarotase
MRSLSWCAAAPLLAGLTWRAEPPLSHPRSAHALAATDTDLLVVGGTGGVESAKPILEVERFDGATWRTETVLPGEGLNAPAAVVFEGKLWVIGGFGTTSNVPVATVSVYDLGSHAWSEAPPLPAPRGGHAAIVFGGRIHVLGGGNSVSTLADHCDFDPATRAWRERAPLSRSKGSPAAVVFEGKLWAIGGRSGMEDFGDVECFDDETNRWTAGPPIEARGTAGAVVYQGTIWVVGGESQAQGRCLASVLRFDPAQRRWAEAIPLPNARNYARTALLGDAFFVVGGSTTAGSSHASLGSTLVDSARIFDAEQPVKK